MWPLKWQTLALVLRYNWVSCPGKVGGGHRKCCAAAFHLQILEETCRRSLSAIRPFNGCAFLGFSAYHILPVALMLQKHAADVQPRHSVASTRYASPENGYSPGHGSILRGNTPSQLKLCRRGRQVLSYLGVVSPHYLSRQRSVYLGKEEIASTRAPRHLGKFVATRIFKGYFVTETKDPTQSLEPSKCLNR